jgi:thiol reductant ABC exporter CydD subunit
MDGESLSDVLPLIGLLAAIVLGRALLSSAGDVLAQRMATRTSRELRASLLAHVVRLGPVWLSGERRGQVATLATRGIDSVEPYVARYLPQLVIAVVVPVTVGFAILTQDLLAAVLVAITAPLIPVFMVLIGMYTQSATAKQWATLGVLSGHFLDVVAGLPTLKAFRREGVQSERMADVDRRYRKATMGVLRVSFLSSFALELLASLSVAVIAVAIGLRLVNGEMDLRTGLIVLILAPEVYLPIRQVGAQFHAAADGIDAAEQVFAVLDTEPATSGTRTDVPAGPVVVEGVSVIYPGSELVSLAPVSLTVDAGRVVAVVGPSGAGKTTLLAALQGFVAPSTGAITAGGADLRDLDAATWRARLGVVAQDPVLVGPTVGDDVRLRRPSATDAEVDAPRASTPPRCRTAPRRGWATWPRTCRQASAAAWPSRGSCSTALPSCSSTSPPPDSTTRPRPRSSRRSGGWHPTAAPSSSWRTGPRWSRPATSSSSSARRR